MPSDAVYVIKHLSYQYVRFGQASKGRTLLRALIVDIPEDVEALLLLAWAELECGNLQEAKAVLAKCEHGADREKSAALLQALISLADRDMDAVHVALLSAGIVLPQSSEEK